MKTNTNQEKLRRTYKKPQINRISLDKEISMVMMSAPPNDPEASLRQENFKHNPFKINQA